MSLFEKVLKPEGPLLKFKSGPYKGLNYRVERNENNKVFFILQAYQYLGVQEVYTEEYNKWNKE